MFLEILTPDKKYFEGEIISVKLPGTEGSFALLNNHAPILSSLTKGDIVVKKNENTSPLIFKIEQGTLSVSDNKVIILVNKVL